MSCRAESLLLCFLMVLGIAAVFSSTVSSGPAIEQVERTAVELPAPDVHSSASHSTISDQLPIQEPVTQGWGGVTLSEASNGQMQTTLQRLNHSGYNAVRVGFSASITSCSSGELGPWSIDSFNQTIQIAQQYKMWVILDYHSYNDLLDSLCQLKWLSFWSGVLSSNWSYSRIVWEPINEPAGSVSVLSAAYQAWITQARVLGDTHWIAIENTISNGGCVFDAISLVSCYPTVTDPLNQTLLSIHPYFFYDQWSNGVSYGLCSPSPTRTWSNGTAECVADIYNQGMLKARATYHMPILDTEGGAVYYSCNSLSMCGPGPPDAVGIDDASYSNTTLHFIQYLTTQMQSENMGWLWWEAGEGSCCGALDTWGNLLRFQPATPPTSYDQAPTLQLPTSLTVVSGSSLSFSVNASDHDSPPQNLTLSCINCPIGASFPEVSSAAKVTGVFTWTPTSAQADKSYDITFQVTDGVQSSNASVVVVVSQPSRPSSGSSPLDSPIAWLAVGGTAGLAIVAAATIYRRRIKRA